jgi:hypothetical protein
LTPTALVCAQARGSSAEDILPLTEDPNDPIGVDREAATLGTAAVSGGARKVRHRDASPFGPEPPAFSARVGEVLSAVPSLHEKSHRVRVELSAGLASVESELEFENSATTPAELVYRLSVPDDAALGTLEVCGARGCRTGVIDASAERLDAYDDAVQARGPKSAPALPVADARKVRDARGSALLLRAAPVAHDEPLRIHVGYVAAAVQHGGVVRFSLPARGMDPRAAPLELTVHATDLTDLRADALSIGEGALHAEAWSSVELTGRAAVSGMVKEVWRIPCGNGSCLRAYLAAAPAAQLAPVEIVLAIDASPSTEGSARSRLVATIAAILARAPQGSHLRALRFASRAVPLVAERKEPRELALDAFAQVAFEAELGAATRFESAWQLIESWGLPKSRQKKLVVIVGDGGITTGAARPFDAARRAGVEVAVVNVSDRASAQALVQGALLTGGAVVEAGAEADAVARRAAPDRLEERVAALFQPSLGRLRAPRGLRSNQVGLELRAGDSLCVEGRVAGASSLSLAGRDLPTRTAPRALSAAVSVHAADNAAHEVLVAVDRADLKRNPLPDRPTGQDLPPARGVECDRRGPALRQSGLSTDAAPIALAQERALCVPRPAPATTKPSTDDAEASLGAGLPSSPLLSMLRQRIVPVARDCFRRDRAGRADYQVRAVFEFELADREVASARIQGKIAEALRSCLLASIDNLAVPRFSGKVVVRYPLVTEREPLPAQIELSAQTADRLDTVLKTP